MNISSKVKVVETRLMYTVAISGMMSIAGLVQNSIGKALKIRLLRGLSLAQYDILLVPKSWSGQGVLGCKIVPL